MEESKRFYDVISKPIYNQYHDVWITVKDKDFLIRVPETTDKTEKYLLKLASIKITNYLKKPKRSPEKDFGRVGRPRKYNYDSDEERHRHACETWREKQREKLGLVKVIA